MDPGFEAPGLPVTFVPPPRTRRLGRACGRRILPRTRSRSTDAWQERGTHDSWALRGPRGEVAPVSRPGGRASLRPNPTAHLVGVGEDDACPSTVARRASSASAPSRQQPPAPERRRRRRRHPDRHRHGRRLGRRLDQLGHDATAPSTRSARHRGARLAQTLGRHRPGGPARRRGVGPAAASARRPSRPPRRRRAPRPRRSRPEAAPPSGAPRSGPPQAAERAASRPSRAVSSG